MSLTIEAGRAAGRDRASEDVLWRNVSEVPEPAPSLQLQSAWLVARFDVGASHARVIAEHAFQSGSAA